MKNSDYYCINGAYHDYPCCETCWNKHPENKPNEMFQLTDRCLEIKKENFINAAKDARFNDKQAEFLFEKCKNL